MAGKERQIIRQQSVINNQRSMAIASRQVAFKGIDIIVEDDKTERGFQERKARRNRKKVRTVGCFSAAVSLRSHPSP